MVNGANIAKINFAIVDDIKKELRLQGHYFTGALESSFENRQTLSEDEVVLEAFAFAYIKELEQGLTKEEIPALDTKSAEFLNLAKWVKAKGMESGGRTYMSASSIAELIWRKWQKLGKPLEGAKLFSKNGKVTGAIDDVFARNTDAYFAKIDEEVVLTIDKIFFK